MYAQSIDRDNMEIDLGRGKGGNGWRWGKEEKPGTTVIE